MFKIYIGDFMLESGLTRKIDGLGRLVIPKEIRDRFFIHENDYLEFLIDRDGFYVRKYSRLGKITSLAQELCDTLNKYLNAEVLIAERDKVVAYSGIYKDKYLGKEISKSFSKSIRRRESLFEIYKKKLQIIEDDDIICSYINETIVSNCEEVGIISLYRTDKSVTETDLKIINIVSSFLTRYLEE